MTKFDTSCGLTDKQIGTIKYSIKMAIRQLLPELPEHVEMKLFFQGRDAWTYSWQLLEQDAQEPLTVMTVKVVAKLKKEFHRHEERTRRIFLCKLRLEPDIYRPIESINEEIA